jgi:hypothetical protein
MWALSGMPGRTVTLLAEKLRPVTTVLDVGRVDEGQAPEELQQRRRGKKLLIDQEPAIESSVAVRRAIALLAQLGTPDAIALLDDLANQPAPSDVRRIARAALTRLKTAGRP